MIKLCDELAVCDGDDVLPPQYAGPNCKKSGESGRSGK